MHNKEHQIDYKFKIALIGDSETGKSSLLRRFVEKENFQYKDSNNNSYVTKTIGVDFKREDIVLEDSNVSVSLSFFDTSGDEKYRLITLSYIHNVQAFIICYDVQNMDSFLNCQYWLDEINKRHKCSDKSGFQFLYVNK